MKIKEVAEALERFAPLPLQEDYDNAGLQIGLTEVEASGALLCLDVTEAVIEEAAAKGCNLIVAHHPLLFRGLKQVSDTTQVERCVRLAIQRDIAIYAAHTNLDNARGGVNYEIAERLGLHDVDFLRPEGEGGSGLIGRLAMPEDPYSFLKRAKHAFAALCLKHNQGPARPVQTIAVCGGSGDFLLSDAIAAGADVFLTGEMHYHAYFGHENQIWIGVAGHYETEQYTIQLLRRILEHNCPGLPLYETTINTNPIKYMV
ncbi:Nif3-like dinuclear metal center hexameric protein [Alloprevotella tannerae]|uniref:Nif3-like dinuclear metal center hexameric protein n=1 Tax=Alloprevotella tannerae TaxID=76122 RepID=UPI0028E4C8A9|nr:Nif3-like dinuclear metal center hexameric protein [Alloprevotella tannerae]